MQKAKFGLEERMTAEVPRWAIAPVNKRQSVAEHQYFVALYASKICWMLQIDDHDTAKILNLALRHDVAEVRTSDIPGPVKKEIVNDAALAKLEKDFHTGCGLDYVAAWNLTPGEAKLYFAVLKLADIVDEYLYLKMEMARGNSLVRPVFVTVSARLRKAVKKLVDDGRAPHDFYASMLGLLGASSKQIDQGVVLPDARSGPAHAIKSIARLEMIEGEGLEDE